MASPPRLLLPSSLLLFIFLLYAASSQLLVSAADNNDVYSPCSDATVQVSDGFTFGIVFSGRNDTFFNGSQLSPCDSRLRDRLSSSPIAVFRPKVDEISLLTINTTKFFPSSSKGYMVAFAGRKYAARSIPAFVADDSHIVTSFTLVLEFNKGRLQNLYWKQDGCSRCSGSSNFVCLNNQDCAIKTSSCKQRNNGRNSVDCSPGIQVAFSGTDKHLSALNSWYEVENLRQYSLVGLYSNLRDSLTSQFNNFF